MLLCQDGDKVCGLSTLALQSGRLGSDLGSAPYLPSWVGYLSFLNPQLPHVEWAGNDHISLTGCEDQMR